MDIQRKKLAVSIIEFIQNTQKLYPDIEDSESYEVGIDVMKNVYGVTESDLKTLHCDTPLLDIFSNATSTTTTTTSTEVEINTAEIRQRITSEIPDQLVGQFNAFIDIIAQKGALDDKLTYEKILRASKQKFCESKEKEIKTIAEQLKEEGNKKLTSKDYNGALESYTKAIKYDDSNAIYYANRSACYSNLNNFEKSVEDANEAIKRNPNYAKAYARLGSALLSLGKYKESAEAYKGAIALEPNNETFKSSLASAEMKISQSSPNSAGGGMGGLPAGLGDLDLGSITNTINSMGGMEGLMQNDMFKSMYNNIMQNPDSLNQFLNPETLKNLSGMFAKK
ncbi:tetratricopeptide-like helical domain-containing protein (TPR) [Tieghemostelium lacteum]|uniref:Tetratricopeptide-like helical domain-containing protein (TPR) n=1 Tax=Tieghemostelium lacteum TaxID=361077 RepID=A0A151ZCR8_TIELA|nr:tetratricopeptide-like helical domain-containing protein (TPR) [Tieghemostelium lacteum]|eukprot:KYQ91731.1 tetratricopeptide-like helical domain-containing protein (TPR) [Tieghemostelium lacteum]